MKKRHVLTTLALGSAAALTLAGCSPDASSGGSGDGESAGTITIGYLPSWTDTRSNAFLLEDQLTKLGYEVELQTLSEAGPIYTALAEGDIDIFSSAVPEVTHKPYMDEYGENIEDLVTYYDNFRNFLAVPTYSQFEKIEDLEGASDVLGGEIIGIEPGAGLTAQTQDVAMPEYGLDDEYELITSSTPAMLTELGAAIDEEREIVVTLWSPFWANNAYDVRPLEDSKEGMGARESMHVLATKGFTEEFPEAAELISGWSLSDESFGDLENLVVNEYDEGQERDAVDEWLTMHPDAFETLIVDE